MPTVADVNTTPNSGVLAIDSILDVGPSWNYMLPARNVLYYTFSLADPSPSQASFISGPITPFNAAQRTVVESLLGYISQITGIVFAPTADGTAADLHFAQGDVADPSFPGLSSWYKTPASAGGALTSYSADAYIYLDNVQFATTNAAPTVDNYGVENLLHYLGHFLGFNHPYDAGPMLPADQNNTTHTVESNVRTGVPHALFGPNDIAALMWLYGGDGIGGTWGVNSTNGPTTALAPTVVDGTVNADNLQGLATAEAFVGGQGNDSIDGGGGVDIAVYTGNFHDYALANGATVTLTDKRAGGTDGTDTLAHVERLQFADTYAALDMAADQAGGKAVLMMAAALGVGFTQDRAWAGRFLHFFDTGASLLDGANLLVDTGIMAAFAGAADNAAFVKFVYGNVTGSAPDAALLATLVAPLNSHTQTQAQWMAGLAASAANQDHVNLVGYMQNGFAFIA